MTLARLKAVLEDGAAGGTGGAGSAGGATGAGSTGDLGSVPNPVAGLVNPFWGARSKRAGKDKTLRRIKKSGVAQFDKTPAEIVGESKPSWWNEPSDNAFAKGQTKGQVHQDWFDRRPGLERDGKNFVFYHATPKSTASEIGKTGIKAGSKLADTAKDAVHFAGRDRGLKPDQIKVFRVAIPHTDVRVGVFPTLRRDFKVSEDSATELSGDYGNGYTLSNTIGKAKRLEGRKGTVAWWKLKFKRLAQAVSQQDKDDKE